MRNMIALAALIFGMLCLAYVVQVDVGDRPLALHAPTTIASILTGQ
ncbi:hypothetical protein JW859_03650 [bacterium]|nr:hypothetical protein [bacterium]